MDTKQKAKEITDYFIHYLDSKIKRDSKKYKEYVKEIIIMLETD